MIPAFTVIDNETGKEIDKVSATMTMGPEWKISLNNSAFFIMEDGKLYIFDMWGEVYECPEGRFSIVLKEAKQ